jgi:hypothetical protein
VCPMDPGVRSSQPGVCPRCGMKLVPRTADRTEYILRTSQAPEPLVPGGTATLTFHVVDPRTDQPVRRFELVHEKLMHLFVVSENLEFFAHVHPESQVDGGFTLQIQLPYGGMYRMLADYYPSGSLPQLSLDTLYVAGRSQPAHLIPSLSPSKSTNLTASLRIQPETPLAGLETKLLFTLDPSEGLEPYLGAWGHMLVASEDLIDLIHLHPFLIAPDKTIYFTVIFPRPGVYKVWTQFQRKGEVNTVVFAVPVKGL